MQKPTALERLWQGVESRCNSDEGLLRLAKALLEHRPKSETELQYIRALVQYVLAKRRLEIWCKRGVTLPRHGVHRHVGLESRYELEIELDIAKEYRDSLGTALAFEAGESAVAELKKRIGSQISFGGAYRTLSRDPFTLLGE